MEALQRVLPYQDIKDQLDTEKKNFVKNFYAIAALIAEVFNNKCYEYWGYGSFKEFISENLDIQISVAYKMVTMINNKKLLNITDEELLDIKPTKLLEVMSLKDPEEVKTLLLEAKTASTDIIKEKVRKAKGLGENVWRKYSLSIEAAEVLDAALDRIKVEYGDSFDPSNNEVKEISNSRAIEMLAANYLAG